MCLHVNVCVVSGVYLIYLVQISKLHQHQTPSSTCYCVVFPLFLSFLFLIWFHHWQEAILFTAANSQCYWSIWSSAIHFFVCVCSYLVLHHWQLASFPMAADKQCLAFQHSVNCSWSVCLFECVVPLILCIPSLSFPEAESLKWRGWFLQVVVRCVWMCVDV